MGDATNVYNDYSQFAVKLQALIRKLDDNMSRRKYDLASLCVSVILSQVEFILAQIGESDAEKNVAPPYVHWSEHLCSAFILHKKMQEMLARSDYASASKLAASFCAEIRNVGVGVDFAIQEDLRDQDLRADRCERLKFTQDRAPKMA